MVVMQFSLEQQLDVSIVIAERSSRDCSDLYYFAWTLSAALMQSFMLEFVHFLGCPAEHWKEICLLLHRSWFFHCIFAFSRTSENPTFKLENRLSWSSRNFTFARIHAKMTVEHLISHPALSQGNWTKNELRVKGLQVLQVQGVKSGVTGFKPAKRAGSVRLRAHIVAQDRMLMASHGFTWLLGFE